MGAQVDILVFEGVRGPALAELCGRREVIFAPEEEAQGELLTSLLASARSIIVRNRTQVSHQLLEAAPSLEVVARAGVGLDNIDLSAADERGIVVVAALGANAASVAEHAVALAFALARDVVGHDRRVREGKWLREEGTELAGKTWAVIGLGATGRATARLAGALGMTVLGYDPFLAAGDVAEAERLSSLPELLNRADIVSLHLALSDDSRALVNGSFLARMRKDALLVNVARGELVDEAALLTALEAGTIAGAGLDVRSPEPPRFSALSAHPRVISTPHIAGITTAAQLRVTQMICEDIDRVLNGEAARFSVGRLPRPLRHPS